MLLACGETRSLPGADTGSGGTGAGGGGGAPSRAGGTGGTTSGPGGTGGGAPETAALLYSGAVVTGSGMAISAPILPRTMVIYQAFPTTLDGEKTMAHDAALLFDWLLAQCAPLYPMITLDPGTGVGLTSAQLAVNYEEVARCAYEQYTAKPYWIPKLIDDVDICGTELGPAWRLITESDLTSLTDAEFQAVSDRWNVFAPGAGVFATFYASLAIWVRAADGTIAAGTLAPGVTGSRVTPLAAGTDLTNHYEGSLGLRCIRRPDAP